MSEPKVPFKRILWAVDPFEPAEGSVAQVARAVSALFKGQESVIEPVYVLNPAGLGVPGDLSGQWIESFAPAAEKAIAALLSPSGLKLEKPRVLFQNAYSLRNSVQTLATYAKGRGADLIVSATHARKGISRLVLGSFTESLLLQSEVPILAVNPRLEPKPMEEIVHPTDFGVASEGIFDRVLGLARATGSKLTLLHVIPHPVEPVFRTGLFLLGGGLAPVVDFMTEQEQRNRRTAEAWASRAATSGVKVEVKFVGGEGGIKNGVLAEASARGAGLIAMAAESGTFVTAVAGSIARQVVREAPCPVWVLRA